MALNQAGYEVPPEMRDFAEKSVDQARKALDGFLGAANKAVDTLQGSTSTLQTTATDATKKTLSYAEQNLAAAFDHAQRLVRAKDFQEAVSIQTEFARTQFQAMQTQLKDLTDMAQSAARTATSHATAAAQSATNQAAAATRSATE
jgi:phasin